MQILILCLTTRALLCLSCSARKRMDQAKKKIKQQAKIIKELEQQRQSSELEGFSGEQHDVTFFI